MKYSDKMKYVLHKGRYYQYKSTDGEVVKMSVMGKGREIIVVRHLLQKSKSTHLHSLDIRYFTEVSNRIYNNTKNGIQIKHYYKYESWLGTTVGKIIDCFESIQRWGLYSTTTEKYKNKYDYDSISKRNTIEEWL